MVQAKDGQKYLRSGRKLLPIDKKLSLTFTQYIKICV